MKNPHKNRERELMNEGKLLAYVSKDRLHEFGDEFVREEHKYHDTMRYLIYRAENAEYASMFRRAYQMYDDNKIAVTTVHVRCGLLLGYEKSAIRSFVRLNLPVT